MSWGNYDFFYHWGLKAILDFRSLLDDVKHKKTTIETLKEKKAATIKKFQDQVNEGKLQNQEQIAQMSSTTPGFSEMNNLTKSYEQLQSKVDTALDEKKRLEQYLSLLRKTVDFKGKQLETGQWLSDQVEDRKDRLAEKKMTLAKLEVQVRELPRKNKIKEPVAIRKSPSIAKEKEATASGMVDSGPAVATATSTLPGPGAQSTPATTATLVQQKSTDLPSASPIRRPPATPSSSPYLNKVWTTPGSEKNSPAKNQEFKTPQKTGPSPEWTRPKRSLLVSDEEDQSTSFVDTPIPTRQISRIPSKSIFDPVNEAATAETSSGYFSAFSKPSPAKSSQTKPNTGFDFFSENRAFLNFDSDEPQRDNFSTTSAFNFDAFNTDKGFNFNM